MRALFAIVVLAIGGCLGCASIPDQPKASALRLEFPSKGVCSGTAIARTVILSAGHCFVKDAGKFKVNGVNGAYKVIANDGKDHVLVRITQPQERLARLGLDRPKQGDQVRTWGNPNGLEDVFRVGRVAHVAKDGALVIDGNLYRGDSGAALFNKRGRVVGVVSGMVQRESFRVGICFPIVFTDKQWAEARR